MKQDWEIYRDTGILGAYRPEQVILRRSETAAWKHCSVTAQPNGRAMTSPVNGRCWSVGSASL